MRVSFEGDHEAAKRYLGKARQELFRLEQRMEAQQRNQGTFQHALSDTAYCFGYVLPSGIRAIHIVAEPPPPEETPQFEQPPLLDFLSGIMIDGYIKKGTPATPTTPAVPDKTRTFYSTIPCFELHKLDTEHEDGELTVAPYGGEEVARFAVTPWTAFGELQTPEGWPFPFSQYTKLKAGMFSGRMRDVVQVLFGFGKLREHSIYDDVEPLMESEIDPDAEVPELSKYQQLVKDNGVQVMYDYRSPRTDGISNDQNGRPWVVQIGITRGVIAMPMPIVEITKDPKFLQKIETLGDDDAHRVMDDMGGFPSGETFPTATEEFDAYVRAGRIIRLATVASLNAFYNKSPYSQSMGWAFNRSGTEAHNTCYEYDPDHMQTGYHFAMNINIDANDNPRTEGMLAKEVILREMLGFARDQIYLYEPALFKVGQLDDTALNVWITAFGGAANDDARNAVFASFNALVVDPLAVGSAPLSLSESGRLYAPGVITPQIKFPEYTLGYLLSHNLNPDSNAHIVPPLCDTTMHVFFKDDELKWCKYYRDPLAYDSSLDTTIDTTEECEYAGEWELETTSGGKAIPAMFYTNDFDDRHVVHENRSYTKLRGVDCGYSSVDLGDDPSLLCHGWITRSRRFHMYQDSKITRNAYLQSAIAVPFYDREAYYYAVREGSTSEETSHVEFWKQITDPHWAEYWRAFVGCAHFDQQGKPTTDFGCGPSTIRKVRYKFYTPTDCNEVADDGEWLEICDNADALAYHTPQADLRAFFHNEHTEGSATMSVWLVCNSDTTPFRTKIETRQDRYWTPKWFMPSPGEFGDTHYIQAMENCYGDSQLVSCWVDINTGLQKVLGGPNIAALKDGQSPSTGVNANFIGVID